MKFSNVYKETRGDWNPIRRGKSGLSGAYGRYSADNWSIRMGESIEPLYDCDSPELEYQRYIAERFQEKGAPVGFNYVDITTSGCEGWINLFFGDTCIAMIQDRHIAEQIRLTTKNRRNG